MRAGAIWDKFTAWVDKIFTTGEMDNEVRLLLYSIIIFNYLYKIYICRMNYPLTFIYIY